MMQVEFDEGVKTDLQGSPWALFIYQREFGTSWHDDYDAAFKEAGKVLEDKSVTDPAQRGINFMSKVDPLFLLKTAWAMARNNDDSFPGFEEWVKTLDCPMTPISGWKFGVNSAINAELFRIPQQEAEKEAEGNKRERKARSRVADSRS